MTERCLTDGGLNLHVNRQPMNSGGEAEIFDAGQWVAKRFKQVATGHQRIEVARTLVSLQAGPLSHPSASPLVLPNDTIKDLWGAPAIVLPRVPANAVDGMRLVLPSAFATLPEMSRGDLKGRCISGARYANAMHAFGVLTGGGAMPDGGLRNVMFDLGSHSSWIVDTDSAVLPGGAHFKAVTTPQFDAPELAQGVAPGPTTDRHTIAVTLHLLMLGRHPFLGSRPDPPGGAEAADQRDFVSDPVWTDDPDDRRNPAPTTAIAVSSFGVTICELFWRAFARRSSPATRPDGATWAHHLAWLVDRLVPCPTEGCWWGWVPWVNGTNRIVCPVCGGQPIGHADAVIVEFLDPAGQPCVGEVMVITQRRQPIHHRHVRHRPDRLHGEQVGQIRRRMFRGTLIAEVDGFRTTPLLPGETAYIGERQVRVRTAPSRLMAA